MSNLRTKALKTAPSLARVFTKEEVKMKYEKSKKRENGLSFLRFFLSSLPSFVKWCGCCRALPTQKR